MHPKVSILIVVIQNEESFLDSLFQSILSQTYTNYEIVCVDNACEKSGMQKIARWKNIFEGKHIPFITLRNEENIGLTKALNMALGKASRKYIARIDPDDTWTPDKLQKQIYFLEKHPKIGILGSNHFLIYLTNPTARPKDIHFPHTHKDISQKLFRRNPFAHSCIVARTELLRHVGGYDESVRYGQDYDLWLRCFPLTKFHNLQEFLCTRTVSNSISVVKQKEQMTQSIKTRARYIRKYHYPLWHYLYLLEPLVVILTPNWIKSLKRKHL